MKLVYFAWVREGIGAAEETHTPPDSVTTVGTLLPWLVTHGPGHARALADPARLRFAVNQEHADLDTAIGPGDEVAIFPPVTGG
ncbi:MAG: molybdopterin converting factor subunit 1 [Alphaproteobacteria bacterium]